MSPDCDQPQYQYVIDSVESCKIGCFVNEGG